MSFSATLKYDKDGLIPTVVQDAASGTVLMVAYMNAISVDQTLATGKVTFWSRSRQKFWIKGESSGHFLFLKQFLFDCDSDCLLVKVEAAGPSCHEGYRSCFFRESDADGNVTVIAERELTPDQIYGTSK